MHVYLLVPVKRRRAMVATNPIASPLRPPLAGSRSKPVDYVKFRRAVSRSSYRVVSYP